MTDSNDRASDPLNKLLKDEGPVDPDKASQQKVQALKALRAGLIRVERLTLAVAGLGVMVFTFAWGLFMTTPDVKTMLFCMVLMMWGLSVQIIFILIYAIRNTKASILKEIKLQRLEQVTGTYPGGYRRLLGQGSIPAGLASRALGVVGGPRRAGPDRRRDRNHLRNHLALIDRK